MKNAWKHLTFIAGVILAQEIAENEADDKKNKSEFIKSNCQKTKVDILIPKWTVSNAPPASVTLSSALGTNCRGANHNKTHIKLEINLLDPKRDCGTTRRSEGVQIIYENKLSWTDQKSRQIEDLANITCIQFLQEKHVRLPSSAAINALQAGPVKIQTQMKLFNDAGFEEELEDLAEKGYAQVAVREFIYVRVAFDFAEDGAAMATDKVVIDSCWGSRSANPDNMNTAYMMIKNGCSADPLGVIIRKNSAGEYASWKFQMYKWVEVAQHEQFIYIHCRAWICTDCKKPEANHACLGDITKFRRRRAAKLFQNREVSSDRARIFSVGPIYPRDGSVPLLSDVKSDDPAAMGDIQGMPIGEEEEEDNFIMAVIVGSVSGFCALFLLIVAIVFVKKYRDKPFQIFTKPAEEEEDEKNVEQGFVFELRTSTDPVIPRVNLDQFLGRDDEPREQRERKTERRSHHGSRMSLNKDDRGGRRRRDRSESRDRKGRSRSESRTREGGRSGSKDRGKDRDRSRSRERSSRHGSREKLHSSSRDLRKSRDNIRGSKSDLRERRSGSRDDLTSGSSKMRKSGSRMSLNDRLPTLDERLSSEAEKELVHAKSSLKKTSSRASISRSHKNDDFKNIDDDQFLSPRELKKSRSKMSVNENGEKISRSASKRSRGRRSESRNRDPEKDRERTRDRSSSKTRERRSESRKRSPKASKRSESRDRRHHSPTSRKRSESRQRSPSRERKRRSPSRDRRAESRTNIESAGKSEEKSRRRSPSRQRRTKNDADQGSTNDLRSGGDNQKRRRRRKNRERPENPDESFSAL